MTDNSIPGPMSMVKIDGAKIKRLREEQGLTQLYLATAVQVTTDTISRWENRRYPSIKKENGIKLAEALNVKLEDLLEEVVTAAEEEKAAEEVIPPEKREETKKQFNKIWAIIVIIVGLVGLAALAFFWYFQKPPATIAFSAERILPDHCIAGQPFPVLIKISGEPEKSSALIIRENIPSNATVKKISPEPSAGGKKGEAIKWLRKVNGTETFAYVIKVPGKDDETVNFTGTAAVGDDSSDSHSPQPISGNTSIVIGQYHWADTDKDNVISDSEILSVYNQYGEIKGIGIDIDQIEEIWLGSGYKWNPATATFEIPD